MKKLFLASLLAITSGLVVSSCNNGVYDANPATNNDKVPNPLNDLGAKDCNSPAKDPFSANVAGDEFVADGSDPLTLNQIVNINGKDLFQVQGHVANFKGEETVVELLISNFTGAKTYTIGGGTVAAVGPAMNPSAQFSSAYGGGGKIVINRDDQDTVAGTFYFKVKNSGGTTREVCGGYFKMAK